MRRRAFISLLGGAAAVWPLAERAQQARKPPTIGFMGSTTSPVAAQWVTSFVQRLRELGWLEGRDVVIEYRWAEGRREWLESEPGRQCKHGTACVFARFFMPE
jgi:hypothetical protein